MNVSNAVRPAPIEHVRLAGYPGLIGFAVVLTSMLALVFPTGKEYADLATGSGAKPDRYSIAYFDVMVRADPKAIDLRLVYVKQLGALGRFSKAIALLDPVLNDPRYQSVARNMRFDLRLAEARSIPEDNPLRKATFVEVLRDLESLFPLKHDAARLRELAKVALELEQPALASKFFLRLAEQSEEKDKPPILADAARWLRASGDGKGASSNYDKAAAMTADPMVGRAYALASIAALEAENAVPEAADRAAEYAAKYPNDLEILMRATSLATACSRTEVARDFGRRVLALTPEEELPDAFLREQAKRELGMSDPDSALRFVKRLVSRHPNDIDLREAEAYIAEWSGDLRLALRDWLFVMKHGRSTEPHGGIRL